MPGPFRIPVLYRIYVMSLRSIQCLASRCQTLDSFADHESYLTVADAEVLDLTVAEVTAGHDVKLADNTAGYVAGLQLGLACRSNHNLVSCFSTHLVAKTHHVSRLRPLSCTSCTIMRARSFQKQGNCAEQLVLSPFWRHQKSLDGRIRTSQQCSMFDIRARCLCNRVDSICQPGRVPIPLSSLPATCLGPYSSKLPLERCSRESCQTHNQTKKQTPHVAVCWHGHNVLPLHHTRTQPLLLSHSRQTRETGCQCTICRRRLTSVNLLEPRVDGVASEITHEVTVPSQRAADVVIELAVDAEVK